jgi:hypothetical protein
MQTIKVIKVFNCTVCITAGEKHCHSENVCVLFRGVGKHTMAQVGLGLARSKGALFIFQTAQI